MYYNHDQSMLYVLADGTLYQIDLDNDEQTTLARRSHGRAVCCIR